MHEATMRERLSLALREAMKVRDTIAVSALRSALSAIANAEAVSIAAASAEGASREAASTEAASTESGPGTSSQYVAGAASGLGSGEVPRRALTETQIDQLVQAEIGERLRAADEYDRAGRTDQAERLRREANVLAGQLPPS